MSKRKDISGAGVQTDKDFNNLLSPEIEEFDVLPEIPPDKEEFVEDCKKAFAEMSKTGKPVIVETKTKFILWEKKAKNGLER